MGKDSEKEYLSIYIYVCVSICVYIETKVAFY